MRYKRFKLNIDFLVTRFVEGMEFHYKCIQGLPEGTKYVRAGHDWYGDVWVTVEHESFPELKNGDEIPNIEIKFNKLWCESPRVEPRTAAGSLD